MPAGRSLVAQRTVAFDAADRYRTVLAGSDRNARTRMVDRDVAGVFYTGWCGIQLGEAARRLINPKRMKGPATILVPGHGIQETTVWIESQSMPGCREVQPARAHSSLPFVAEQYASR